MNDKSRIAAALLLATLAAPAFAQAGGAQWSGFYVGGNVGASEPAGGNDGTVLFDTNLDGQFGDTVRTAAAADAFSPGFCGGAAIGRTPASGCSDDKGGADYGLRLGYDWQVGHWVFGVVGEYTKGDARDSVSAFSTTPALYTLTRDLDNTAAIRARVGMAFGENGDWLAYATAGAVRATINNSFTTSNTANGFAASGDSDGNGFQAGLGVERKVLDNLSLGLEYLHTSVQDEEARVRVTRGTAPATNPFLLANPGGTDFRRGDEDFDVGSLRLTATLRVRRPTSHRRDRDEVPAHVSRGIVPWARRAGRGDVRARLAHSVRARRRGRIRLADAPARAGIPAR